MNPLETATMQEIFDELSRRNAGVLLVTENPVRDATKDENDTVYWYHGGSNRAIGMAYRVAIVMANKNLNDKEK